jgi:hypothetical protein
VGRKKISSTVKKPTSKSVAPGKQAAPVKSKTKVEDANAFFAALKHPLKKDIAEVRAIMLGADKKIGEGVKWNSLSFKTADYFATINLRSTDAVQLVFHRGAKSKDGEREMAMPDPKGLMKWLSSDRCLVTVGKGPEIAANRKAFEAVIRAWVRQL